MSSFLPHGPNEPCCGACATLGQHRPEEDRGPKVALDPAVPDYVVTIQERPGQTRSVRIQVPVATIGRAPSCDIVIADDRVSRRQCQLLVEDGALWVADSASGCGTFVNGERVSRVPLRAEDRIHVADAILSVSWR